MKQKLIKPPPLPLDRNWAWMIVLGVFIYTFFMVGIAKSYGILLLAFIEKFEIQVAIATVPISLSSFVYAFGAPTALLLSEKFTARKVVMTGAIIAMVGIALSSLLVNMTYVSVFYGLCIGIGNSACFGNGLVMIGKYFRKYRSLATGIGLAGASIGQFVIPPVIQFLLDKYGLGGALLILSSLYFHAAISGALFRPAESYSAPEAVVKLDVKHQAENVQLIEDAKDMSLPPTNGSSVKETGIALKVEDHEKPPLANEVTSLYEKKLLIQDQDQDFGTGDDTAANLKAVLSSTGSIHLLPNANLETAVVVMATTPQPLSCWRRLFDFSVVRRPVTLFFILVSFLVFFGYFNFIIFLPSILKSRGVADLDTALLVSVCGGGDLISRIGVGFLADSNYVARYKLKAAACFLCGVSIFIFLFTDIFELLAVLSFLYGFLGGAYVVLFSVVLLDFVGLALMSKSLAIVLLVQGVGGSIGQILLGLSRDHTGSYTLIILLCSFAMVTGGLILFAYPLVRKYEDRRLRETERKQAITS